jgi:hypothetical protein
MKKYLQRILFARNDGTDDSSSGSSETKSSGEVEQNRKEGNAASTENKVRHIKLYAELISDRGISSEIPPLKVLINEKIAETAADQIRDSHAIARELAKSLLLDFLHHPTSKNQFGQFLDGLFKYESLRSPTRNLIYWSLTTPDVYSYTYDFTRYQAIQWFRYSGPPLCSSLIIDYISSSANRRATFAPLLAGVITDPGIAVNPLTELVVSSLPDTRSLLVQGAKAIVQETLKSEQTK